MGGIQDTPSLGDGIHVFGAVEDFDIKSVSTRADDEIADSYISEMTMFVFDKDNKLVQGYNKRTVNSYDDKGDPTDVTFNDGDKCSSAINIQKANPTFLIDTKNGMIASLDDASPLIIYYDNLTSKDNDLSECKIYIVANAYHELEAKLGTIKTLSDLAAIKLPIDNTLAMPMKEDGKLYRGFPMIGTHANQTFDLTKAGNNHGAVAKIPLKKLYSNVRFSIQVNANQVVEGQTPKFELKKVEIFNIPRFARLGRKVTNGKPDYLDSDDYIVEMVGNNSFEPTEYYHFIDEAFKLEDFSRNIINHTSSKVLPEGSEYLIEFGFYMPEHKVTPNYDESTYPDYPVGMEAKYHQYYKPELVGAVRNEDGTTTNDKHATYVRIHGNYTDHNGQIKKVAYDIYLGQNNTDDFTIKRNQLLKNKLVITGLTNYHDAYGGANDNISIDHRVDVEYQGFNLSMERTALLDSHFEVRPLDIELSPGSTMKITIPEEYRSWIAMESDDLARKNYDDKVYTSNEERKCVRKYFTTGLIDDLTEANNGQITIEHNGPGSKIFRIWFYIDENPNVYDKLWEEGDASVSYNGAVNDVVTVGQGDTAYTINKTTSRICPVEFKYYGTDNENTGGGAATVTRGETINFQQWNLWRVWSEPNGNGERERYYDIEHEEEYLHNYASDDSYGSTQNGMPWGLDGKQLSNTHYSFDYEKHTPNVDWDKYETKGPRPYYDFYIKKHDSFAEANGGVVREYPGQDFTEEIVKNTNAGIEYLTLVDKGKADSAVEYCYNRNKRDDDDGTVDVKWYLPAADEMEDIIVGGYASFKEFQDNFYWTSQPAYIRNIFYYEHWSGRTSSSKVVTSPTVYDDNPEYARATKVIVNGQDFEPVLSGLDSIPNPYDNRTTPGYTNLGYFYQQHKWKHWYKSVISRVSEEYGPDYKGTVLDRDERYSFNGDYFYHLKHLYDMTQEGYQKRTEYNRVRCVRRSFTTEGN